jgi:hypothetical protein
LPEISETAHGPDAAAVVQSSFQAKEQIMSDSTLDPDNIPVGSDRVLGSGHGTRALGPSDNSDSGSDVTGGGALGFDSDTDAEGTGERSGVEMDVAPDGDIGFDRVIDAIDASAADDGERVDVRADAEVDAEVDQSLREERRDWSRSGPSSPPSSRP